LAFGAATASKFLIFGNYFAENILRSLNQLALNARSLRTKQSNLMGFPRGFIPRNDFPVERLIIFNTYIHLLTQ